MIASPPVQPDLSYSHAGLGFPIKSSFPLQSHSLKLSPSKVLVCYGSICCKYPPYQSLLSVCKCFVLQHQPELNFVEYGCSVSLMYFTLAINVSNIERL